MFRGLYVALVTPFRDGKVDYEALAELVLFHLEAGTTGLVPCGTTGESPALTPDEARLVIKTVIETADGQCQVLAGTGSNNTRTTIEMTQFAQEAGADGALVITPYYNKPSQEGLYRHFKAVHDATTIPIMLYNVPGRTGVNLAADTAQRLAELDDIRAVKEASLNLNQVSEILRGTDLDVLAGDDAYTVPIMALGGTGCVSVVGNIVPKEMVAMIDEMAAGNFPEARKLHLQLYPLFKASSFDTNPIPIKTALKMLGRGNGELRLPLTDMADDTRAKLQAVLTQFGMAGEH